MNIVVMPGDDIGPEIMAQAIKVLDALLDLPDERLGSVEPLSKLSLRKPLRLPKLAQKPA